MTPTDWEMVRMFLGIPEGWTLRPRHHDEGYWTLTATDRRGFPLPCGHRSMRVTDTNLVLATARMALRLRRHRDGI